MRNRKITVGAGIGAAGLALFLGVGGVWIWLNPGFVRSLLPGSAQRDEAAEIRTLEARVVRLEQQSPPADPGLTQRVDAIEQRLGQEGGQARLSVDLRPLLARLDALEARSKAATAAGPGVAPAQTPSAGAPILIPVGADVGPLIARLDALEKERAESTADRARLDALAARIDTLASRESADIGDKLSDVEHRLSELSANQTKLTDTSGHIARLAQLEIALAVLTHMGPDMDWAWLRANLPAGIEAGYDGMVLEVHDMAGQDASAELSR